MQSINDFKNFCRKICILVRFSENISIRCYSDMVTNLIFMFVGLVSKVFPHTEAHEFRAGFFD